MDQGGEMALTLGFRERDLIRGVAPLGALLVGEAREKSAAEPLSFFLMVRGRARSRPETAIAPVPRRAGRVH